MQIQKKHISYFHYQIENANISGLDKVKMYQQIDI